eukprot:766916-Hanusia_phi.AAC.3
MEPVEVGGMPNSMQESARLQEEDEKLAERLSAFFKQSYQRVPPHWKWLMDVKLKDQSLFEELQQNLLARANCSSLPRLLVLIESLDSWDLSALLHPPRHLNGAWRLQVENLRTLLSLLPGSCVVTSGPVLSSKVLAETCDGIDLFVMKMDKLSIEEREQMLRATVAAAASDVRAWS